MVCDTTLDWNVERREHGWRWSYEREREGGREHLDGAIETNMWDG
jgi:hypothetical protein